MIQTNREKIPLKLTLTIRPASISSLVKQKAYWVLFLKMDWTLIILVSFPSKMKNIVHFKVILRLIDKIKRLFQNPKITNQFLNLCFIISEYSALESESTHMNGRYFDLSMNILKEISKDFDWETLRTNKNIYKCQENPIQFMAAGWMEK